MTDLAIDVSLPGNRKDRSYQVHIGAGVFDRAGAILRDKLTRPRTVIISDSNVMPAVGDRLKASLQNEDVRIDEIILPPGEATKSLDHLGALCSDLLKLGVERQDVLIALGGGVIGDLVGLAAALLRRGCSFVQAPTTLLAQVDSSVGGKTAINTPEGKNLIGAFHQPLVVLADTSALASLPAREMRAGYAEVVKYAAISDRAFFDWLRMSGADVINGDLVALQHAVSVSVNAKARIVSEDETEKGVRQLLNLGHTFGHALEAATGYSNALLHGEAVAIGMALAFDYAAHEGVCPRDDANAFIEHLKTMDMPHSLQSIGLPSNFTGDAFINLMMQDKKVKGGALTLILPRRIGDSFVQDDADADSVRAFLNKALSEGPSKALR